jgi:hypothetical protein
MARPTSALFLHVRVLHDLDTPARSALIVCRQGERADMAVRSFGSVVCALVLVLTATSLPLASVQAQDNSRTFPETGKTMGGIFLQYWDRHGGLAQQGYPISDVIQETSDVDRDPGNQ